jgi:acetyl coenzyme A synthetase (ADP forming)-like protein
MEETKAMALKVFFEPRSIAVIGASRNPTKIGNVILRNVVNNFKGEIYPVNPNADAVLGKKAYKSILAIPKRVDLAVIAVPAELCPEVMRQCARKKVRGAVIISGGFSEIGRNELEEEVKRIARKGNVSVIGPNCVGVYSAHSQVDTLFLPRYRLERPREGGISFITQSGAVGSAILDWAAAKGFGVAHFISYGNAADVDEVDLLEFLGKDRKTKVICMYVEGTKRGRELIDVASKVTRNKPVISIKGGRTAKGAEAVASHTGSLAGSNKVWTAAFRQAGIIEAACMRDMFNYARVFAEQPVAKGNKLAIVTNGGGFGVMAADACLEEGLELAELERETIKRIKKSIPVYAVAKNPIDLVGDADIGRYKVALDALLQDRNVDAILVLILFQTAGVQSEIVDIVAQASHKKIKPIVAASAGGDYTQMHMRMLEKSGVPTFDSLHEAVKTLRGLVEYGEIVRA